MKATTVQTIVTTRTRAMTARQVMTVRTLLRRRFLRMRRKNFMRSIPYLAATRREFHAAERKGSEMGIKSLSDQSIFEHTQPWPWAYPHFRSAILGLRGQSCGQ